MTWELSKRLSLKNDRVPDKDADRQQRTAAEIIRRFSDQPGVVLADEVGMGKTYVALAVAVSVIEATKGRQPVVVMVPSSVASKWPREWEVFQERCMGPGKVIRAPATCVKNGSDFLKLLDDPPARRNHLIFLSHGALTNSLSDPYIRLAIVRRAFSRRTSLANQRRAFPRWAGQVLSAKWEFRDPELVETLLSSHPRSWLGAVERVTGKQLADNPVPEPVLRGLADVDVGRLVDALAQLPVRWSPYIDERLSPIRTEVRRALEELWKDCLGQLDLRLPLLIMDEAHHMKNPNTVLATLFANDEAEEDADLLRGPLGSAFDRMLFLTATPFQLGHHELIEVLKRFLGIRWKDLDREDFVNKLAVLEHHLTAAQTSALRLDRMWGRIEPGQLKDLGSSWWKNGADLPDHLMDAAEAIQETKEKMELSEEVLRPWVIRHARPDKAERRKVLPGAAIHDGSVSPVKGLAVTGPVILPFLLAARTQAIVSQEAHQAGTRSRAFFAEGLASSFEAYRETRSRQQSRFADETEEVETTYSDEALWYLDQIDVALPREGDEIWGEHPKIRATVLRAGDLWEQGEKVLVFCFYIATGRALRSHISAEIEQRLVASGARVLELAEDDVDGVKAELDRVGERFFDPDAPVTRLARTSISEAFEGFGFAEQLQVDMTNVVLRFLRTPSFLVRNLDLRKKPEDALDEALNHQDSSRNLRRKIGALGEFMAQRVEAERIELMDALEGIQTGTVFATGEDFLELGERSTRRERRIPNVRLANGQVSQQARRRLMLAFNTPFFPEVLIASAVMAEGVDLHLDCRHVIHHDLDWNPSVLEQRTGRLDRLGGKSEVTAQPIVVYEPFLEGTQDERQYRVVKDRERWFNVVMGERLQLDEWKADRLAARVALPEELAAQLTMNLSLL